MIEFDILLVTEYLVNGGSSIKIRRTKPPLLVSLPRLITRLPDHDLNKEKLAKRLYQLQAGYSGELKVDYYLQKIGVLDSSIILTNVELTLSSNYSFQIDTLIISRQTIFILEVKNIKGNIYFKSNPHHLLREIDGDETIMECPLTQLEITKENLSIWLAQKGIEMNISGIVVLANNQCIVKETPPNPAITYMKRLAIILRQMNKMTPIYKSEDIQMIAKLIKTNQTTYNVYPLCDYFNINPNLLKKGQLCSICHRTLFYRTSKIRYCMHCKKEEPHNPSRSMQDWFMLISHSITNKQCREFLQLKNPNESYYILKTLKLEKVGKSIATKYYWPANQTLK